MKVPATSTIKICGVLTGRSVKDPPWRHEIKTNRTGNINVETRHALSLQQSLSVPSKSYTNSILARPLRLVLNLYPVYPLNRCKTSFQWFIFREVYKKRRDFYKPDSVLPKE